MKKKLLSLVLAGAMVASTSVSAFAKTISDSDNTSPTTNVEITGDVESQSGATKPGTFNVTVPTAANFTINKDGKFIGTTIDINNLGTQDVEVFAHAFTDTTGTDEINVLGETAAATEDRSTVSMNIRGNAGVAYLGTVAGNNKNGIYSDKELANSSTEIKLATISSGQEDRLTLDGKAGKSGNAIDSPIRDTFTLILKIAKATK